MSEIEVQNNSAVYYEKRYSGWGLRYHKSVIDWMMEGVFADHEVLDVGCGTGIVGRLYSMHKVLGVDISPEMISRTPQIRLVISRKDVHEMALGPLQEYYVADATAFKQTGTATNDVIVCRSLLHHLPDHKLALSEFHRVLKPGGKLVLWETNKGWLAQKVRAKTQHGDRFSEYHHAFRSGELERDLRAQGFRVEEVRHMGFLAYPLWGFPDIIDFSRYIPFKPILFQLTMAIDYLLESIPFLNRMSWAVGIKAVKV